LSGEEIATWTVLIVDDEEDNLNVPSTLLTFYGAKVHTAENGQKGIDILKGIKPSFILLDISMPVKDGWQMLEEIRADAEKASIPVIALTAHAMVGDKEKGLDKGFDAYITKPFSFRTFLSEIHEALEDIKARRRPRTQGTIGPPAIH
jgi:CheY-like chemotaxis protein